ncbi:MAG: hypothetical protein AAF901_07025 [Bacteroidota bacterium]
MQLKHNILLLFTFVSLSNFGQNRELTDDEYRDSTVYKMHFIHPETCDGVVESFECDVQNNTLFLFIPGSIVSLEYKNDKRIESEYGIYFIDYGCTRFNVKCFTMYNKMVFDYLVKHHDDKWVSMIRPDLYGFEEWKKDYASKK